MIKNQLKTPLGNWAQTVLGSHSYNFSEKVNTKEEKSSQTKIIDKIKEELITTEEDEIVNIQEIDEMLKKASGAKDEETIDFELPDSTQLSQEIHDLAPEELKPLLNLFKNENKDIVLLSCLTTLSSIFHNVSTVYRRELLYCNLYLFVVGKPASGKGNILIGKRIIKDLLEKIEDNNPNFHIAGNISSSKIIERLVATGEQGNLMIETEADSISKNFKSEWGSFSDILRSAFQHEEANLDRVSLKMRLKKNPKLSLAIAGTPFQLIPMIGTKENGLYSRIMIYNVTNSDWIDDEDDDKTYYIQEEEIERLNKLFIELYSNVNSLERRMRLSTYQRKELNNSLKKAFYYLKELESDSGDTVKRLGIILTRIFMIYTILEIKDELTDEKKEFECTENAFKFGLALIPYLLKSSIESSKVFQSQQRMSKASLNDSQKQILDVLPSSFNNKEGVELVTKKLQISESSVNKALKILKDKEFLRKKGSLYQKVEKTTS